MRNLFPTLGLALLLPLLAQSCRSTHTSYLFTPSPLEILVGEADQGPILARVLVGIPGAERENRDRDGYPELLVRMRIENQSNDLIHFDPADSTVLGSDLAAFGAGHTEPAAPITVPAGETQSFLIRYPFPQEGDLDAPLLTGINMRFALTIGERTADQEKVAVSATLERLDQLSANNNRTTVVWATGWRGDWGAGLGRGFATPCYW